MDRHAASLFVSAGPVPPKLEQTFAAACLTCGAGILGIVGSMGRAQHTGLPQTPIGIRPDIGISRFYAHSSRPLGRATAAGHLLAAVAQRDQHVKGRIMKRIIVMFSLIGGFILLNTLEASAVVCARGVYRAGCVAPRGAVGYRGAAVVRRGAVGYRSATVVRRGTVVRRRAY